MKELSIRQQRIIEFIRRFVTEEGYPPTIRDIQNGCGISSTSVVDYNLDVLERKGVLRRHREVSRGIELAGGTTAAFEVPVLGYIAAGEPIPAPASDTWSSVASAETISIPAGMLKGKTDVFALKVKGTSMIDALINDGDIVLMQHASTVDSGEMAAVWLRAEKEVTLKKVFIEHQKIRLQPANSLMQPIYVDTHNLEVQGRVVGVIRQLI